MVENMGTRVTKDKDMVCDMWSLVSQQHTELGRRK